MYYNLPRRYLGLFAGAHLSRIITKGRRRRQRYEEFIFVVNTVTVTVTGTGITTTTRASTTDTICGTIKETLFPVYYILPRRK